MLISILSKSYVTF